MTASLSSTLKSINPASLEVLGEAAVTPNIDIAKAGQLSRQSFESWHKTKLKDRLKKIETFHQLLASKQDEIARLITLEVGKPLVESYAGELSGPLDTCLWLIKNAEKILADQQVTINNPLLFGKTHVLKFDPAGLIGIISPWNYPFSIPVMTILMALVAGNTVILKPSEKSPLTGLKIGELFREAGFPKNAVTVITGAGVAGQAVANLDLARLIFTGSIATGQKVMHSAASSLIRITLELGGKDAAIVLPDAPVERTARAITWGAFTNAGQACASIERLYLVRSSNNDALLKRLVELASKLKMGDPLLETTELGPLIDVQQYEHVVNQVEEAIAGGAKVLCGAGKLSSLAVNTTGEKKLAGYFYEPTIITDVNKSMKIMQDETFGPVLPVVMVDSPEEAIALANDSKFGLTASVWSADIEQAQKVADKLEVGSVFINDCLYTHARPELPWSGLKKSGFGCSHSQFGLLDLVNIKQIAIDRSPWHRLWWYPYGATKLKAIRTGLQLLHDQKQNKGAASAAKLFEFISSLLSLK
jgi:succinate-semialdehyde dehydrogenase/glutarate-semialdehyde dehydrogenase